jgi:hypothetical protein
MVARYRDGSGPDSARIPHVGREEQEGEVEQCRFRIQTDTDPFEPMHNFPTEEHARTGESEVPNRVRCPMRSDVGCLAV